MLTREQKNKVVMELSKIYLKKERPNAILSEQAMKDGYKILGTKTEDELIGLVCILSSKLFDYYQPKELGEIILKKIL